MYLSGYKHDERKALLFIVVLKHKVIEISTILEILVKGFNAPYADILEMPIKF